MHWPESDDRSNDWRWLIRASSIEVGAHRAVFLLVLCPLVGYWLPAWMLYVGLHLALEAQASASDRETLRSLLSAAATGIAFLAPAVVLLVAGLGERARLRRADSQAGGGMALPTELQAKLTDLIGDTWQTLPIRGQRSIPRVVCQPSFQIVAHAYDGPQGQVIEISAELAKRLLAGDKLAVSILRHEMAHLVFRDLPAIRRQSIAAAATVTAIDGALVVCAIVGGGVAVMAAVGGFPPPVTLWHRAAVELAIILAALSVTAPLMIARFAIQRYSGFAVALTEVRADVAAGVWGEGLTVFADRIRDDPTVRAPSMTDIGLAYLSPALTHLPVRERTALLADTERLGTPKLRYFGIAIVAVWVLAFHQGEQGWDTFLCAAGVAVVQGLTVGMVISAGWHRLISARRAIALGVGLMVFQALPLVSIEGIVYLTQHLTMAIASPGGFGSADHIDYWGDTRDVAREFGQFVVQATGGSLFPLAVSLAAGGLWLAPRLLVGARTQSGRFAAQSFGALAAMVSFLVSYRFFQKPA